MPTFDLQNYVPVHERLAAAQAEIVHIVSDRPVMLTDVLGFVRVKVELTSGQSATGTASFRLDLAETDPRRAKSAQATNPIEDAETSALGRALAFLGYESSRGIASREEVLEARRRAA